jgi:hypothetical protein
VISKIKSTFPATPGRGGFTLISILILVALLVVLVLSLGTYVTISTRGVGSVRDADYARQSALFGLNTALGELQAATGPDQRITAPASIMGTSGNNYVGSTTPITAQASWTGVWKSDTVAIPPATTPSYSPASPDTKTFVGWLVSGTDNNQITGNFTIPTHLSDVTTDVSTIPSSNGVSNWIKLFDNSSSSVAPQPYAAQVQKVALDTVPGGTRYFAFWVEDEGVKADLSWNQTPASSTTSERAQALRLSTAPGPDYGVLNGTAANGPFGTTSYPITYPIANDGTTPFLTNSIANIQDPLDLINTMPSVSTVSTWVTQQRANLTSGSRGVLSDVKLGGLRRDLSLAFEMDGTTDVSSTAQPTNFNTQTEEFVGKSGGDRLDSPYTAPGMSVPDRFLYRNLNSSGTPFATSIPSTSNKAIRGPSWYAMRDYANLYKRLSGSAGTYTLTARSYYPNRSGVSGNTELPFSSVTSGAPMWDYEYNSTLSPTAYVFRPAASNYAPVLLGATCLLSMLATNYNSTTKTANLALGVDPIFYIWNPYNRNLTFRSLGILLLYAVPGDVTFVVSGGTASGSTNGTFGPVGLPEYLQANGTENGNNQQTYVTYLVPDPTMATSVTMTPGEVMMITPEATASTASTLHNYGNSGLGGINNTSGTIMTTFPGTTSPVVAAGPIVLDMSATGSTVKPSYGGMVNQVAAGGTHGDNLYLMQTTLPPSGATLNTLQKSTTSGDEIQYVYRNAQDSNGASYIPENLSPGAGIAYAANTLYNTATSTPVKSFFGITSLIYKPATAQAQYTTLNPVEVFTRFNPNPMNTAGDMFRNAAFNTDLSMLGSSTDANTLLAESGISFPASGQDAFWGQSLSSGPTSVPMIDIPSSPLTSIAAFANANLSWMNSEPFRAVGNSWSPAFISPSSLYGTMGIRGDVLDLTRNSHGKLSRGVDSSENNIRQRVAGLHSAIPRLEHSRNAVVP